MGDVWGTSPEPTEPKHISGLLLLLFIYYILQTLGPSRVGSTSTYNKTVLHKCFNSRQHAPDGLCRSAQWLMLFHSEDNQCTENEDTNTAH